jgi:hypothetical protein
MPPQLWHPLSSGPADFDRGRRIRGESDHREADDQAPADEVESRDGPAVLDGPSGGTERHARAGVPVLARRLPAGRDVSRILRGVSLPLKCMLSGRVGGLLVPPVRTTKRIPRPRL